MEVSVPEPNPLGGVDEGKSWGSLARSVGFDDSSILAWRPASSIEPPEDPRHGVHRNAWAFC